jgi:hypothetical protein
LVQVLLQAKWPFFFRVFDNLLLKLRTGQVPSYRKGCILAYVIARNLLINVMGIKFFYQKMNIKMMWSLFINCFDYFYCLNKLHINLSKRRFGTTSILQIYTVY